MEGKRWRYTSISVYLSKGKHIKTYVTKFVWHAGSQRKLSMITQIIEGQVWYYSSWIQYILGKVQGWWGPRHIMSRGFGGCHRVATTSRKGVASKRYSVFSVNDNPEPVDFGKIDEKYRTSKNSSEVVQGHNIVEIPGGLNSRRWNKIESELDRWLVENKCSTLVAKWNQRRTSWTEPWLQGTQSSAQDEFIPRV